jgi:hypothetical protein
VQDSMVQSAAQWALHFISLLVLLVCAVHCRVVDKLG